MKKAILFFLLISVTYNGYSQIEFEKGYFIDNNDNKTECFIKNNDWKYNPTEFEYKTGDSDIIKTRNINNTKSFEIINVVKFSRFNVNIDRSSNQVGRLSNIRKVEFKPETLFLKHLVNGSASLYQYNGDNLTRYFYSSKDAEIQQLVYKKYNENKNSTIKTIKENKRYQQQLINSFKCDNVTTSNITRLRYSRSDLTKVFEQFNSCLNSNSTSYSKPERKAFNISLRPRVNFSSAYIDRGSNNNLDVNFDKNTTFGFGLELEYVLGFNKNKWSVFIEPTFRNYKSEKEIEYLSTQLASDPTTNVSIEYNSIELPIGLRHYFFLNKKSKIFVNFAFVADFSKKTKIDFETNSLEDLDIESGNDFIFGIGYKHKKISVEFRQNTGRKVLPYLDWDSKFSNSSIILGYTIY